MAQPLTKREKLRRFGRKAARGTAHVAGWAAGAYFGSKLGSRLGSRLGATGVGIADLAGLYAGGEAGAALAKAALKRATAPNGKSGGGAATAG